MRSADRVNAQRGLVTRVLRGAAVALATLGLYLVAKRLAFGFGAGSLELALRTWNEIGETHSFYRGVGLLLVAGLLAATSRRVAGWIVALPPDGCPACGHAFDPDAPAARCAECGRKL